MRPNNRGFRALKTLSGYKIISRYAPYAIVLPFEATAIKAHAAAPIAIPTKVCNAPSRKAPIVAATYDVEWICSTRKKPYQTSLPGESTMHTSKMLVYAVGSNTAPVVSENTMTKPLPCMH